jgi:leader peptidase (prepilin peptidase)/N-methyltransferase
MELIYLLKTNTTWLLITVGLFSLLVGSFLNVVIYRLPIMLEKQWKRDCQECLGHLPEEGNTTGTFNLVVPRSQCPVCGHKITALENIPIISYLALGGKCRDCKTPISLQYPMIELITALLSIWVALQVGFNPLLLFLLGFTWVLVCLFMIDAKTMLLPDILTYPLLWVGLLVNMQSFGLTDLNSAVMGAILGYLSLWSVFHLFLLLTGKEGMGYGDFKLLAALGAWGGWQVLPFIIFSSALFGAIFGISLILFKKHEKANPMPFGPWLAMAGFLAIVERPVILQAMDKFFLPY